MASADNDLRMHTTASSAPRTPGSGRAETSGGAHPVKNGSASPWPRRLLILGILVAALNLRPAISGLGPLLQEVRDGLGMSGTVAGLLTSAPSLCFAVFGGLAPRLARRWGPAAVVLAGLTAITGGLALRSLAGGTAGFLAASALALAGIAVSNVLMPSVVKRWFPDRVGSMTGLYSMGLALGTAGAAAVTVPMTNALGGSWRLGIGAWAVLAALAIVPWGVLQRHHGPRGRRAVAPAAETPAASGTAAPAPDGAIRITRSPTAWALGVFFGLQASAAYITMGWLPQIFRDAGVPAATAGLLLALTMGLGVPLAFVVPRVAARMSHQGPVVLVLGLCGLSGYAGLWFAPAGGAWAWALLLGISNCAFPLALTMIGMRARSSAGVARLSAFAQSTGYLLSIPGPLLVGALKQHTGGWHAPLVLMTGLLLAQISVGLLAGRDRCVEDGR